MKGNMKTPAWYDKCTPENHEPLTDQTKIALPHEVCIKNYLPEVTMEEYKLICQRAEERSK